MNFIVDQQLSRLLARHLREAGHDAWHVKEIGLLGAGDTRIWLAAVERRAAIITCDADFQQPRLTQLGRPQVVWIRFGNTRKGELIRRFDALWRSTEAALLAGEPLITLD